MRSRQSPVEEEEEGVGHLQNIYFSAVIAFPCTSYWRRLETQKINNGTHFKNKLIVPSTRKS